MNTSRRRFLAGLIGAIAAPHVARASGLLMPVRTIVRADALTLYVRTDGSDSATGLSPAEAVRTIQAAVDRARGAANVILGPGRFEGGFAVRGPRQICIEGGKEASALVAPRRVPELRLEPEAAPTLSQLVGRWAEGKPHSQPGALDAALARAKISGRAGAAREA